MEFNGYCPECELKGKNTQMLRYNIGIVACPVCGLVIIPNSEEAFIGLTRVPEDLKHHTQTEIAADPSIPLVVREHEPIKTKEELAYILQTKISPFVPFSLHNLIDYYARSLFANHEQKKKLDHEYRRQSGVLKIDFTDNTILNKLKKRDVKAGNPKDKSFRHTYELMKILFNKYYDNDTSWLPEMGMGPYQLALCKKHLPNSDSKLLKNNPYIRKQRLMSFLIDLVEIIYLEKKTMVSKKYL